MQNSPANVVIAATISGSATSRSASSKISRGAFPPSSRFSRFNRAEPAAMTARPTAMLPV